MIRDAIAEPLRKWEENVGKHLQICDNELSGDDITEKREEDWISALRVLYGTTPTTMSGLVALVDVFEAEDGGVISEIGLAGKAVATICRAVRGLAIEQGAVSLLNSVPKDLVE